MTETRLFAVLGATRAVQPRISRRISEYHERHAPPNKKGNYPSPSLDRVPDQACGRTFCAWP